MIYFDKEDDHHVNVIEFCLGESKNLFDWGDRYTAV